MTESTRFDLAGRTVIVTGGGKGIGKVYTQEFARAGARVVAADIDGKAAEGVAGEIAAGGGEALALTTDVADEASAQAMAKAALERFGSIDVLINNASLMSVLARRSWLEIPVEEWDRVMRSICAGYSCAAGRCFRRCARRTAARSSISRRRGSGRECLIVCTTRRRRPA
jgi:NAD(P)-dependent dehydrogenase (short-subunit alcohol dehydrogenase family)